MFDKAGALRTRFFKMVVVWTGVPLRSEGHVF